MSGAAPNVPVQLQPVEVHKTLQDGEKFIKWDEDSGPGTPVTLRIDPKGFFLYWIDQNNEVDFLDIATIRDARTGQYAKVPKDPKLRQIVTMGSQDTLEEKTVTICYGADFVNLTFINFCCTKKEIAQLWTESIFRLAYNLSLINASTMVFLQKVHTRLLLVLDKSGNLPAKYIVKFFAQHKDDRKRIEKALELTGLPFGKNDFINPTRFTFDVFYALYKQLTQRTEVEKIFCDITGSTKNSIMTAEQVIDFLNKTQRDPRLNEILHPYVNSERAKDLVSLYEDSKFHSSKGQISYEGFLRYLMSENNPIISPSKLEMCDDLEQPMAHYFINSSHNTYLTGHQITGKSSVEIYRQSLLAGCRCVELDFWNGRFDEPVIVHGYTFVQVISAKEVLEAIAESAFKTSDLPVILSFENHCNPRQQAKIANYCREIFGEMLLEKPLESHPLESGGELPPPSLLRRKIIIKNKKKHHHHHHHKKVAVENVGEDGGPISQGNGDIGSGHGHQLQRQSSKDSSGSSDIDSSSEDEGGIGADTSGGALSDCGPPPANPSAVGDKAQQAKETEAGAEISALVNYVQPVHFSSFENSEKKNRFYEMSSFDEKQATTLLKERPIEFVNYNKHQLSRVYPAGTRFDSSNFMPQVFWNAGCQLVALNYQTLDLAMQLNLGIYEYNMRSGFLLKPEFMRRKDRRLDPFTESTVDGIIAGTVSITVISGQFLSDRRVSTFVEVEMYGLPADTVRKKFRTKIVPNNGINPAYGEEPFVFKKVVLPELASLRLAVYDDSGKLLGHRVLPVVGLCHGYRHVHLRNELNQPLLMGTLFLHIIVKDYVPDGLSDLAEALANPIKYQSEREKREIQLAVLTEDMEAEATDDQFGATVKCDQGNVAKQTQGQGQGAKGWSPRHRASVGGLTHQASLPPSTVPLPLGPASSSPNISGESQSYTATSPGQGPLLNITDGETEVPISQDEQTSLEHSVNTLALGDTSDIEVESVEKILTCKAVKEKRQELEKKLETMRRKHEKERVRHQSALQKSCDLSGGPGAEQRRKFYMTKGLVKRLSSKNIESSSEIINNPNVSTVHEGEASSSTTPGTNGANDSLQMLIREHASQVHELKERYLQLMYVQADKYLKQSQQAQLKLLRALLERETAHVMRQLQQDRRGEVKALAKKHKDRDELVRIKREVASQMVERGVTERVRLTRLYDKRKETLTKQHEKVKQQLQDQKEKELNALVQEYEFITCIPEKEQTTTE